MRFMRGARTIAFAAVGVVSAVLAVVALTLGGPQLVSALAACAVGICGGDLIRDWWLARRGAPAGGATPTDSEL